MLTTVSHADGPIKRLKAGEFVCDTKPLINDIHRLKAYPKHVERLLEKGCIKTLIEFDAIILNAEFWCCEHPLHIEVFDHEANHLAYAWVHYLGMKEKP